MSAEEWVAAAAAVVAIIGALATAAVQIINAVKGVGRDLADHAANSRERAQETRHLLGSNAVASAERATLLREQLAEHEANSRTRADATVSAFVNGKGDQP